jgi:Tol biopolymer transport system component
LRIALDVVNALEAAHASGIIHRDLKPSNVKITPDGHVKILDFGIAKNLPAVASDSTRATTVENDLTAHGTIIGTPAYMSPEQIAAGDVDRRSDVWSFGCLLYEMLTGRRAFAGTTYIELADSIRQSAPNFTALPRNTPERLRRLVARCLEKDPRDRLQDIADAHAQLRESETPERPNIFDSIVSAFRRPRRSEAPSAPRVLRLKQFTFASGVEEFPAWSPDGKSVVFSRDIGGIRKLFLKTLSGDERQLTPGDFDELQPAFVGDSRVLFVRAKEPGRHLEPTDIFGFYGYGDESSGDLWSIDINTLRETRIVENGYGPSTSRDEKNIAIDASWAGPRRIWILDERGRNPQQITTETSEAVSHIRPSWSPDGKRLTFQHIERTKFNVGVVDLSTRRSMTITDDAYQNINPVWSSSGRVIYFSSYRGGGMNVWQLPIHEDGAAAGAAQQLTTGAGQDVQIAVSPDGKRLAYATLRQNADIWRLPLRDDGTAAGAPQSVIATTREDSRGAWSPDGQQVAFNSDRSGDMNIWLHSLRDRTERQLTRGAGGDFQPNWSPDARHLVFFSSRSGHADIWKVDVTSGALTQVTRGRSLDINPFFSPDGTEIVYQSDASGRLDLWLMRGDGTQQRQLTDIGVAGHFMRWLPDGFIYFRAPSHGTMRISAAGGEPQFFSKNGGAHISFSPDASQFIDVVAHKVLWLYGADGSEQKLFTFDDPDVRIDYPVWSPDGRWLLFDRFKPEGGDIWMAEGIE